MGTTSVFQFMPLRVSDQRIIENLADFLEKPCFKSFVLPGEFLKIGHQILVWNRNPCILLKVLQVVQELFFGLESLD